MGLFDGQSRWSKPRLTSFGSLIMAEEVLSNAQQENLITLLCFNDEAGKIVRNAVEVDLF